MISIIIVEDHLLVRSGLISVFEQQTDMVVVAEFPDGKEFLQAFDDLPKADIILMDVAMPWVSGLEVLEKLIGQPRVPPIVLLSMYPHRTYAAKAKKLGARGYITKDCSHEELLEAIRTVVRGESYGLKEWNDDRLEWSLEEKASESVIEGLSQREQEVFRALCMGMTVKETAYQLGISVKSVSTYKTRLMEKLKLDSLSDLIRIGMSRNF